MSLPRRVASRISGRNRERKLRLFMETLCLTRTSRVLDVGFSDHEYGLHENYLEQHYPWLGQRTALGVDEPVECPVRYPDVSLVHYDGMRVPFEDACFDVAHSNAVTEHVDGRDRQPLFPRQMLRVARAAWLTTASRGSPIDSRTLILLAHWLPPRPRDAIYTRLAKSWATGDYLHLLYSRDIEQLLLNNGAARYRVITNRFVRWPMDYIVVVDRSGVSPAQSRRAPSPACS